MENHAGNNSQPPALTRGEIYYYLRTRLPRDYEDMLMRVEAIRHKMGPRRVRVGGVIQLSTLCVKNCLHCAHRVQEENSSRFRLSRSEVLAAGERAAREGVRWLLLRSGEDPGLSPGLAAELGRELKQRMGFRVTLAMGERGESALEDIKRAGLTSYWLNHDTCDPHIYRRIRPSMHWVDRLRAFETAKNMGFAVGGGFLVGAPNQTFENFTDDLSLLTDRRVFAGYLEPFLPPEGCPGSELIKKPENRIVVPDLETIGRAFAVLRILRPDILIVLGDSHVRALDAFNKTELFTAGANAIMLDYTPAGPNGSHNPAPFLGRPAESVSLAKINSLLAGIGAELDFTAPF